jgi:hypothetical protein
MHTCGWLVVPLVEKRVLLVELLVSIYETVDDERPRVTPDECQVLLVERAVPLGAPVEPLEPVELLQPVYLLQPVELLEPVEPVLPSLASLGELMKPAEPFEHLMPLVHDPLVALLASLVDPLKLPVQRVVP